MYRNHGSCSWSYRRLDSYRVDTASTQFHINQNRYGVHHQYSRRCSDECPVRNNHFVSCTNVECQECEFKSMRSICYCNRRAGAVEVSPLLFKLFNFGSLSCPPLTTVKNFKNQLTFCVIKVRPEWKRRCANRCAAVYTELFHG